MKVLLLVPMADGLTGPAIKYGFEQLGHVVKAVDPRTQPLKKAFLTACEFKPDLVFCSKEQALIEPVRQIKQKMKVIACMWNVDTRVSINNWKSLFPLIEICDYYFVVDSKFIPEWRKINQNTFWLPEGLQIETHNKPKIITEEDRAKYSCDVCWIGGRTGIRSYRNEYLDAVEQMEVNFKQWGCSGNLQIKHGEHDKAVTLSKINLALSGCPQNGKYTSQRNYIILGGGGFLLELAREGLFDIFPHNILDTYTSPQNLVEKIRYWLPREKERKEYAERGYKWVRRNATFKHRIKTALDYMGGKQMKTKNPQWRNYYKLMGDVNLAHPWEDKIIRHTMGGAVQKKRFEERAEGIAKLLNNGDSILEIGCGYGGLAREILKRKSVSYTVVDNEEMLTLAKRFLGDGVEYIDATEIETLQGRKFDLFIADFCLTETPAEYRKYVFENIARNCQRISILENDLFNIERDIRKYFTIEKTIWPGNAKRWEYAGERRKDII